MTSISTIDLDLDLGIHMTQTNATKSRLRLYGTAVAFWNDSELASS